MHTRGLSISLHVGGCRRVTDVYTRATIPADDGDSGDDCGADAAHELESDGSVGAARFIMCIVEATVHAKKLFVQTVHTMDEAAKQHHVRGLPQWRRVQVQCSRV